MPINTIIIIIIGWYTDKSLLPIPMPAHQHGWDGACFDFITFNLQYFTFYVM